MLKNCSTSMTNHKLRRKYGLHAKDEIPTAPEPNWAKGAMLYVDQGVVFFCNVHLGPRPRPRPTRRPRPWPWPPDIGKPLLGVTRVPPDMGKPILGVTRVPPSIGFHISDGTCGRPRDQARARAHARARPCVRAHAICQIVLGPFFLPQNCGWVSIQIRLPMFVVYIM